MSAKNTVCICRNQVCVGIRGLFSFAVSRETCRKEKPSSSRHAIITQQIWNLICVVDDGVRVRSLQLRTGYWFGLSTSYDHQQRGVTST